MPHHQIEGFWTDTRLHQHVESGVQLWLRGWRASEVKKAKEICEQFQPQAVALDPWGITELERILNEEGITLKFVPATDNGFEPKWQVGS